MAARALRTPHAWGIGCCATGSVIGVRRAASHQWAVSCGAPRSLRWCHFETSCSIAARRAGACRRKWASSGQRHGCAPPHRGPEVGSGDALGARGALRARMLAEGIRVSSENASVAALRRSRHGESLLPDECVVTPLARDRIGLLRTANLSSDRAGALGTGGTTGAGVPMTLPLRGVPIRLPPGPASHRRNPTPGTWSGGADDTARLSACAER